MSQLLNFHTMYISAILLAFSIISVSSFSMLPDDIHFWFFPNNGNPKEIKYGNCGSISASGYIPGKPVVFIVHGGNTNRHDFWQDPFVATMKTEYLKQGKSNVIGVDYSQLVSIDQNLIGVAQVVGEVLINVLTTGNRVAEFINFQRSCNVLPNNNFMDVHLVGWSLGGQVAGVAGGRLKNITGQLLGRISGLDPMGLSFTETFRPDPAQRLDETDASFVDVTYTSSSNSLTPTGRIGTANFYPNADNANGNGGNFSNQPGCPFNIFDLVGTFWCAHAKGYQYFANSINNPNIQACKCSDSSLSDCRNINSCANKVIYGENVPKSANGYYYFKTS